MTLKRYFDIAVSSIGIAALTLPVLGVAFAMAATYRQAPFFCQKRVGQHGTSFNIIKIRTMKDAFNEAGHPLPDDLRTAALGNFLRKTKIDELPQLINVLKGEMSLVGPRPIRDIYSIATDAVRCSVQPGMTGLSQISGGNSLTTTKVLELDKKYIKEQSFGLDLSIIIKTPYSIFKQRKAPHSRTAQP